MIQIQGFPPNCLFFQDIDFYKLSEVTTGNVPGGDSCVNKKRNLAIRLLIELLFQQPYCKIFLIVASSSSASAICS